LRLKKFLNLKTCLLVLRGSFIRTEKEIERKNRQLRIKGEKKREKDTRDRKKRREKGKDTKERINQ